jgi:hypothetical protein
MWDESDVVGRVLEASTTRLTVGCQPPIADQNLAVPSFGALLKVARPEESPGEGVSPADAASYGLVYNVSIEDDLFVRQLVAAGVRNEEYIADQRQRRQVPVVVEVLLVGFGGPLQGTGAATIEPWHYLPPRPPTTLDKVYACKPGEIIRFTGRHDWLRTVLSAADTPADALAAAAVRAAALVRPLDQRNDYLLSAGRELARLLASEPIRLDGILQQLR